MWTLWKRDKQLKRLAERAVVVGTKQSKITGAESLEVDDARYRNGAFDLSNHICFLIPSGARTLMYVNRSHPCRT